MTFKEWQDLGSTKNEAGTICVVGQSPGRNCGSDPNQWTT